MIRNYCTAGNNKTNYNTFRGCLYNYDFDGYMSISNMAERIVSDWKFDEKCRKNIESRKEYTNKNE